MTTMIDTDDSKHDGMIMSDWFGDTWAACQCGWHGEHHTGNSRQDTVDAKADLAAHLREVRE